MKRTSPSELELKEEVSRLRAQVERQEQELNETRQRYDRLVELLPDAVTVADMEGNLLYVNEAGLKLLKAAGAEEVVGRSVDDFLRRNDRLRMLQKLQEGEQVEIEEQITIQPNGQSLPVESASVPIRYEGKEAILTTLRDLTGRKIMEKALSETQELFYEAFHLGPAALGIFRLSDGVFIDANEQFLRISGYEREELLSTRIRELGLWKRRGRLKQLVQDLQAHGGVHELEARLRRKDGKMRTVLASARQIDVQGERCVLTCAIDISERKRAEVAERENRALLTKIFQASPAPICISHLEDGTFIDVNEEYCSFVGYSRDELIGRSSEEIGLWNDPARREELVRRLQTKEIVHDFEVEVYTREGEVRTVLCSYQEIQVQGTRALLAVHTDITQRKHEEQALRRAKEYAEEMDRFKTSMLRNLTHEVRTPLTVISGFASALREGVRPEYKRFVDLIERSGQRLLLMLDTVLDLAKLESGVVNIEASSFNAVDIVRRAARRWKPIAEEKNLSYDIQLPDAQIYVFFDHNVLRRVVGNVIDNAIKFTEEGGIELLIEPVGQEVNIIIRDTGVGIAPSYLPDVFDEFSQESKGLERSHQGSGIGLSVSKRLIELGGGSIQVESKKGEGSKFVITVPAATS